MGQIRRRATWLLVAAVVVFTMSGCIQSDLVPCDDGRFCAGGSVCTVQGCAAPSDVAACAGLASQAACTTSENAAGYCSGGTCLAIACGNHRVDLHELCDDGNQNNGDGCSADCKSIETCGNGVLDPSVGEQCDDRNLVDGDGCQGNCQLPRCGDHIVDAALNEACDEGAANSLAPDALCRPTCRLPHCGDRVVDVVLGEKCDDGNNAIADGCTPDCRSNETCGNGYVDFNEQCDDGNRNNGDGCRNDCTIPHCGNGIIDADLGEQCDAGAANSLAPDAPCRPITCQLPHCGDGVTDGAHGEVCDDGNLTPGDGCRPDCQSDETCGNGELDFFSGEQCDDHNTRGRDGCGTSCQLETRGWADVADTAPSARITASAYDAARGVVVMFGGADQTVALDQTWEWDGVRWTQRFPVHKPQRRSSHAMTYDSKRKRVQLFSGNGDGTFYNDLWEWDGADWHQRPSAHVPPGRYTHGFVYDSKRDRLVVFGGANSSSQFLLNDTWEFGDGDWHQMVSVNTPPARWHTSLGYDPARGVTVLYGGMGYFDTWIWNGVDWTAKSPSQHPVANADLAMYFDSQRGKLNAFGGAVIEGFSTVSRHNDIFEWDGNNWTQRVVAGPPPTPRFVGVAAYDQRRNQLTVFGGAIAGGVAGDTLLLRNNTWSSNVAATLGPSVQRAAAAYDPIRGRFVVFGGVLANGALSNATYEWDGAGWTQRTSAQSPSARAGHTMVYDSERRAVVLFGGYDSQVRNDFWSYNGTTWINISNQFSNAPSVRQGHVMIFDSARKQYVVFGGSTEVGRESFAGYDYSALGDTWVATNGTWQQLSGTAPPARASAAMAYNVTSQTALLFGGSGAQGYAPNGTTGRFDDTWEWTGNGWREVTVPTGERPPRRWGHVMAFDPWRRTIVMASGDGHGPLRGDAWEFVDGHWTPIAGPEFAGRRNAVAGYVATTGGFIMQGGSTATGGGYSYGSITGPSTTLPTTSVLSFALSGVAEVCDAATDYDGDGAIGCTDGDCWAQCAPLCTPETSCSAGPSCGDGTCNPLETCGSCALDCGVCAAVCGDAVCASSESATSCPGDCHF